MGVLPIELESQRAGLAAMMKLGFVSAILPDLVLPELLTTARELGYRTVEVMCWPAGRAERRYAGVTHIDVEGLDQGGADRVRDLLARTQMEISALGYYPNPLSPDRAEREQAVAHLEAVMRAAHRLGLGHVNTFAGRDPHKTIDECWPDFVQTFRPLVRLAEDLGLKLGIENCPMLFSRDEWPGGKNLAISPAVWERMFTDLPSPHFGLNYDPSHLLWQHIDPVPPIHQFRDRIFHVHAKDARVDREALQRVGVLGLGWHTAKLPGLGDCDWRRFFGALTDIRYNGAVCVEVEDRAFEETSDDRKRALLLCRRFLEPFVV